MKVLLLLNPKWLVLPLVLIFFVAGINVSSNRSVARDSTVTVQRVLPRGCVSIDEFKHIQPGDTRAEIDKQVGARGYVYDYDDETSPPHRFIVIWYRLCELWHGADYADSGRVEVWYYRHSSTRKSHLATLRMTNTR